MKIYATSYVLYDMIGISIVMIVAIPVSWATGPYHCTPNTPPL